MNVENHKANISLTRKAVTQLSRIKLTNLEVKVRISLCHGEADLCITVFECPNLDNRSFEFYPSIENQKNETKYLKLIEIIKKDDFQKIIDLSGLTREFMAGN